MPEKQENDIYQRGAEPSLLLDTDLGNLEAKTAAPHTPLTYHRTWETGLGVAIRVTTFDPDFYCSSTEPLTSSFLTICASFRARYSLY